MKLTKEECVFALAGLYSADDTNEHIDEYKDTLQQLINEHFDEPMYCIDEFIKASERLKNEPLKPSLAVYEVREINKFVKALDKACEHLSNTYEKTTCGEHIKTCMENHCLGTRCVHIKKLTKEQWKEYLLND